MLLVQLFTHVRKTVKTLRCNYMEWDLMSHFPHLTFIHLFVRAKRFKSGLKLCKSLYLEIPLRKEKSLSFLSLRFKGFIQYLLRYKV